IERLDANAMMDGHAATRRLVLEEPAEAAFGGKPDERLGQDVGERHRGGVLRGTGRRAYHDQFVAAELVYDEPRGIDGAGHDADVCPVIPQVLQDLVAPEFPQVNVDVRMLHEEPTEDPGKQLRCRRRVRKEPYRSAHTTG